jgi:hypothetical protein
VSHSRETELWNDINVIKESITIRTETAQAVGSTEVLGGTEFIAGLSIMI